MPARLVGALLAALRLAAPVALAAQAPVDSARPEPMVSGFLEASYVWSSRSDADQITGRLYDRFHDEFALNALALAVDLPYDTKRLEAGAHAELLVGQNATVIMSRGFNLGDQADVPQFWLTLNIPTRDGNGVQLKLGRIPTLMGLEVIEEPANPNWSEGNQFIYLENFTGTGLSVEHKFSDHADAQLRVINGWDLVKDNNTRKSFMGRVGWYPQEGTTVALVWFTGPEQAGDPNADRSGGELLGGTRVAARTTVWVQGDYGREQANPALPTPMQDASWWGVGVWVTHDLSPAVGVALRGDYVNDEDGARTSGVLGFPVNSGQKFGSITATANVRRWRRMLLRPELRWDRSSLDVFDGHREQVTLGVSAAYVY